MGVGDNIRARRKQLGMSAEELAEMAGLSPTTIYRYESGEIKDLKTNKLIPVAKALRTTPVDLMMGEEAIEQLSIVPMEQKNASDAKSAINNIIEQLKILESVQYGQQLTQDEAELLNIYRSLAPEQREKAKRIMQALI